MTLSYTPHSYVRPHGNLESADLIIVGEQPGRLDVVDKRPFTGSVGRELSQLLAKSDIAIGDCYRTYVIKDLETWAGNMIFFNKRTRQIDVTPDGAHYMDELQKELSKAKPGAVILCVGNIAMYAVTGQWGVTKRRGSIYKSTIVDNYAVPCIHPSTIERGEEENRLLIQWDIMKAVGIIKGTVALPNLTTIIRPSFQQCVDYLQKMFLLGIQGEHIAFDIEVSNGEMCSIAFGSTEDTQESLCIPFVYEGGSYFSIPQEITIMKLIGEILENAAITKLGQNLVFDTHFLLRKYGIKTTCLDDTFIAQKILMGDYPCGLDFICSVYTNIPYYKDEGKAWFSGKNNSFDALWEYNAKDVLICLQTFPRQKANLQENGNWEIYRNQCDLIEPLTYLMEHGIRCDIDGMVNAAMGYKERIESLKLQMPVVRVDKKGNEVRLSAQSPKQLKEFFYDNQGYDVVKDRKTGKATTNDQAMKRISRKGSAEAKLVQEIRKNNKVLSTYMPIDENGHLVKIDRDGRIRCSYNPVGTRYSRLSSSANIFGTGMNL